MSNTLRSISRRSSSALVLVPALVLAVLATACFGGRDALEIESGSTLVIEVGGDYVEAAGPTLLSRIAGDRSRPFIGLLGIFSRAERDDRIANVVVRLQPISVGWAQADELRAAIGRLRDSGRHVVAHIEVQGFAANKELYVASAADEILVAPGSALPLVGLAAEYLFLGGFWEKLGIDFDVAKAGRYKSAVEVYAERTMSEDAREMANSLLDDTYARFVAAIAEGRDLTTERVEAAIDAGAVRTQQLEAFGLVDGEAHLDALLDRIGGPVVEHADYATVDPETLGFEAVAEFALIYGTGPVVQGEAEPSLLGGQAVFASETISRAIIDASEDDTIRAILLRIDSPGGSALASEIVWHAIGRAREAGKPVVVSMADVAASGGYYVAAAADAIVADPGTLTGSIGVFAIRPVLGGLFEKLDIGIDSLTRGRHADFLLSSEHLSPGALARLQTSVSDTYQLFLARVAEGRGLAIDAVDKIGQGRVWTGAQAYDAGLVDELGGLYTAARRAKIEAGLDPDADVYLVPYPRVPSLSEQIFDALGSVSLASADAPADGPPPADWPPSLSWPRHAVWPAPFDELALWARWLPAETPLLVPPMLIEIR